MCVSKHHRNPYRLELYEILSIKSARLSGKNRGNTPKEEAHQGCTLVVPARAK